MDSEAKKSAVNSMRTKVRLEEVERMKEELAKEVTEDLKTKMRAEVRAEMKAQYEQKFKAFKSRGSS